MIRCKAVGRSIIRAWKCRDAFRLGAHCSVLMILSLVAGCPLLNPCRDVNCDDGDACTADSCAEGECTNSAIDGCCVTDADCDQGFCSEAGGNVCVECITDENCEDNNDCTTDVCAEAACTHAHVDDGTDCDDGNVCTDGDACTAGACGGTAIENCCESDADCSGGQTCDLETGECVGEGVACTVAGDCDDQDPCTTDECVGGFCSHAAKCDDGLECTNDSCDAQSGNCTNESNCGVGKQCNQVSGECEPAAECQSNAQCENDGVFCNGPETCGADGFCESGGNPCAAGLTCNEATLSCDAPAPACIEFTTAIDTKSGTESGDSFCALWGAATNAPTLQTGDTGTGGGGADSLTASFQFTSPTTVQPTLTGIETITVTDLGTSSTTLSASGITGATTIQSVNSANTNPLIVSNLGGVVDVGLENTTSGLTAQFTTSATAGAADAMDVFLTNVPGGTLTITSAAANGIESVTIASNGTTNTLASLAQNTGTSLATVTVTGAAPLTINAALPSSVATVTATGAPGGVTLDVSNNTGIVSVTGGAGNDTFTLGANYIGAGVVEADTVVGGSGTNTLALTSLVASTVAAAQSNVTGISALTITNGLANAVTSSHFSTVTTVNLRQGFTGAGELIVATGTTIGMGTNNAATGSTSAGTVTIAGTATTDAATMSLADHDTVALAFNGVETLNLQSNHRGDGNAADGGVNIINGTLTMTPTLVVPAVASTINVAGSANLTISGAVTAGTINASGFTGALLMQATAAAAINITSGTGNDTLFGSAGADTLNAGSGTNTIEGRSGVDTIGPLGSGVDTIRINIAGLSGADRKQVSGFAAGVGGDVLNIDADNLATLRGTNNFVSSASLQVHSALGALTVADATEVVRVTSGTVANFTDDNSRNGTNLLTAVGGNITVDANQDLILIAVADVSGNTGVYFARESADGGAVLAAEDITLVAVLQATPVGNLVYSNFSNAN